MMVMLVIHHEFINFEVNYVYIWVNNYLMHGECRFFLNYQIFFFFFFF